MSRVTIPGRLVNKANSYEIHRNKEGRSWIAPSDAVKSYEALVAWTFLAQEKREWVHNEPLELKIWLINQRHDCDAVKALGDAIQQSGRINNDRQFRKITIEHVEGKTAAVELEVEPLNASLSM